MGKLFRFNSIRKKILFGFSIVIFLVVALGVYNVLAIKKLNDNTTEMVDVYQPFLNLVDEIALDMTDRTSLIRGYLLYEDEEFRDEFVNKTEESIALENQLLKSPFAESIEGTIERKVVWGETTNLVLEKYDAGNKDAAMKIMREQVKPLEEEITSELKAVVDKGDKMLGEKSNDNQLFGKVSLIIDLALILIIIAMAVIVALRTASIISKPIVKVKDRMKTIADGDFTQGTLEIKANDEIGELVRSTNEMTDNTRELLNRINAVSETVTIQGEKLTNAANEVKLGTEQVAVTMEELATGAETQANSTSDLANLMGMFTNKVEDVNKNGENIESNSSNVLEMTNRGSQSMQTSTEQMTKINHIVKDSVDKMKKLDDQTQEISKLVLVIKDIADQTNLLALNAAIEAARAGEHGKGFAVVADEVRKLAEQVALSVNDITKIVTSIQSESDVVSTALKDGYNEVEQGTVQIKATDEIFDQITDSVKEMVTSIHATSQSLLEVSTKTQEMNKSVEEIASVSEEAAAGVEETAASTQQASSSMDEVADSSQHLSGLAEELNELINRFKV
ncbi:methyl-accepting chemotaxis protein [Paraliobacillus salinarum]|uniref:methyl-accepting chemotaxis protein n=1 Tax=Paraliobacillus salinarum TaxID=1158996 RepID=UPI0015F58635|nr:methyl-accepting chemotaxis protein [Paraliobacillus salinarum]